MSDKPTEEEVAQVRYGLMQLTRILSLSLVLAGIAITNEVLPAPFALGVVMIVIGLGAFFFGPPLMVRRWKAGDRGEK